MVESADLICNLVYDYYEARILMGACRYGEVFPPLPQIAKGFQMAPRTVRVAFARLEKNGYVQISPRKPARVVYWADSAVIRENAAQYFVPRTEGIVDFCQSGKLLIEPVWEYAQGNLGEKVWAELKEKLAEEDKIQLSVSTKLHILVFCALQNKLILNFYWELLRYIRFPYLVRQALHEERDQELLVRGVDNETEFMREAFAGDFGAGVRNLLSFCSEAKEKYGLAGTEQIPFRWNVYWHRPQLCYTMVSRIIMEVISGTYPAGTSLPSMPVLSKQLQMSYRTLRRTLSILDSLGIIRLHQGRVSDICMEIEQIDFSRPEVKAGFRIYRESLQFTALTVEPVLRYTLENVDQQARGELTQAFKRLLGQNKSQGCFKVVTDFVVERCPLAAVRECYSKLAELLVWGYPFVLYRNSRGQVQEAYTQTVRDIAACLDNEEWTGFVDVCRGLIESELQWAGKLLPLFPCSPAKKCGHEQGE